MKLYSFLGGMIVVAALAALLFGLIPGLGVSADEPDLVFGAAGNSLLGLASYSDEYDYLMTEASVQVTATDISDSPGKVDHVSIDALISDISREYRLIVREAMPEDPLGRFQALGGVRRDVDLSELADGNSWLPDQHGDFALFGYGDITCHGEVLALGVPVRLFAMESGPRGTRLALDIGDESFGIIQGQPEPRNGIVRVLWFEYQDGFQPLQGVEQGAFCGF